MRLETVVKEKEWGDAWIQIMFRRRRRISRLGASLSCHSLGFSKVYRVRPNRPLRKISIIRKDTIIKGELAFISILRLLTNNLYVLGKRMRGEFKIVGPDSRNMCRNEFRFRKCFVLSNILCGGR